MNEWGLSYWNTSCATTWIPFRILAMTLYLRNFLVLDLGHNNQCIEKLLCPGFWPWQGLEKLLCLNHHMWSLWSQTKHYYGFYIDKKFWMMYNSCIFAGIAICIYGHSDHTVDITIEFILKNSSRWYVTLICQYCHIYMDTLITQQTSPLNSHEKWFQMIYNTCIFVGIAIYKVPLHSMGSGKDWEGLEVESLGLLATCPWCVWTQPIH